MKKILIILNSYYETGAYNSILVSCEALKNEFEFHFAVPKNAIIKSELVQKYTHYVLYEPAFISKNLSLLTYNTRLKKSAKVLTAYLEENDISILHVNDIYNLVGAEIKKQLPSIYLIQHLRLRRESYIKRLFNYFVRKISQKADRIIAVSDCVLGDLGHNKKAIRIYDLIGLEEKEQRFEIKPKVDSIVYIGRLIPGKGHDLFIQALGKMHSVDFKVRIIGGVPQQSKFGRSLLSLVMKYKLEEIVSFEDFSTNVEKSMKEADIIVNFSESESFSRVCAEALFYGIPLITSDCGGPSELLIHQESGILVANKNVDRLTQIMQLLVKDYELRKKLSLNSRKVLEERIDDQTSIKQLIKLYNQE